MWLIHQHFNSSNAIDYYSVFKHKESALRKFRNIISDNIDFLNMNILSDLYNDSDKSVSFRKFKRNYKNSLLSIDDEDCIYLTDDDYISLIHISNGNGRRP